MKSVLQILRALALRSYQRDASSDHRASDHVDSSHHGLPVPIRGASIDWSDIRTPVFLHEDVRRVVDHQIAYLSDADDKAVRTVRINAVIIGAVLSIYELSPEVALTDPLPGVTLVSFLASMAVGIGTYTTSDAQFGPSPEYIDDVLDAPTREIHWRFETLRSYADWIENNEHVSRRNGTYLLVSQLLLLLGLTILAAGIAIEFVG